MKVKALGVFKSKFFKPCKKLLFFFKLKPKKPIIKALKKTKFQKSHFPSKPMSSLLSIFHSPKKSKDTDNNMLQGLKSPSNVQETPVFPSTLTPALSTTREAHKREDSSLSLSRDVDEACRSFENYLAEMIVEEGKTKDLIDVEELLYCWKNLKSPVFIDLVCRFYGELCKDLFSSDNEEGEKH